jgi:NHL repeat
LYIADAGNNRVRKVTFSTGNIAAYAGTGNNCTGTNCAETGNAASTKLSAPTDVVLDSSGNLFISDTGTHTIRKVDTQATPQISTFAGLLVTPTLADGTGSAARFSFPAGLAIDSSNNLFLADRGNIRIRKITSSADVTTIAGGGAFEVDGNNCDGLRPPTGAWVGAVYDVAVNSATGDVFYPHTIDFRVCKIAAGTGNPISVMGTGSSGSTGDGGAPANAQIEFSRGITMTTTGLMYLSHSVATGRIRSVQNP